MLFIACVLFIPNFGSFINMKGPDWRCRCPAWSPAACCSARRQGFRLSVASVIACAGVTTAVVINMSESLWLGIGAGLLLGVLCGFVNGFVIAKLKINALITTLATMQIVRGRPTSSDGKAVGIEDERFFELGYATGSACRRRSG